MVLSKIIFIGYKNKLHCQAGQQKTCEAGISESEVYIDNQELSKV
jgi:hypothetical protein